MQRLSRDVRDGDDSVVRIGRRRSCEKIMETTCDNEKVHRRIQQSKNIEISAGQGFQTSACMEESGDFESALKEWTVHFLEKDQPMYCPVETLRRLELKIGCHYGIKFLRQNSKINVRVHNIDSGEKSLTFTIGNEAMLLCRITGCPEERSPNSDDDTVYEGDFKNLLGMLKAEDMNGASISFGCVIFKDFLLKKGKKIEEEEKSNWETFSG